LGNFPSPTPPTKRPKDRIRDTVEKLDALRKDVLARHEDLTLTKLYNVLEALRAAEKAGTVLSDKDRDIATRGCVSLIRQYHDTIDAAVAEAYGWPADLADEEILKRLVASTGARRREAQGYRAVAPPQVPGARLRRAQGAEDARPSRSSQAHGRYSGMANSAARTIHRRGRRRRPRRPPDRRQ
jgi:hypothetical protein